MYRWMKHVQKGRAEIRKQVNVISAVKVVRAVKVVVKVAVKVVVKVVVRVLRP